MGRSWLIARHEFLVTITRPSYRIVAAAVPILAALGLVSIALFQAIRTEEAPQDVLAGYVDFTVGPDGEPLFVAFQRQNEVTFVPFDDTSEATAALLTGDIDRLYIIPEDYLRTGIVHEIQEERAGLTTPSGDGASLNETPLGLFLLNNLFVGEVGPERANRVLVPFILVTTEVDDTGAVVTDPVDAGRVVFFLAAGVLLIVSVFTTSGYLLQGLNEEKENRIMEVLLSSVKPEHLMLGKLGGLGAAGLLQILVWGVSGVGFVVALDALVDLPSDVSIVPTSPSFLLALPYFILGYFFFGGIMAALGAVTTSQREAGQVTFLVVMPGVAPFWFIETLLENPEGALARTLSFVPFTAPMAGLARLSVGGMGPLDVAISLALLLAGVALVMLLTVRLFRAYLLMFGQRPSFGQILRTLRGA